MAKRKKRRNSPSATPKPVSTAPKSSEYKKVEMRLGPINWKTRLAVGLAISGSLMGIGIVTKKKSTEAQSPTVNNPVNQLPKTPVAQNIPEQLPGPAYEKEIQVEGMRITLDESWKNYRPENNVSASENIREIYEKGVLFLNSYGIQVPERITLSYQPELLESNTLGKTNTVIQIWKHNSRNGQAVFNSEEEGSYWMVEQHDNPIINLGVLNPSTLVHELFHVCDHLQLKGSALWAEGLAEALQNLFEEKHPELQVIHDLNHKTLSTEVINGDRRTASILNQPEVLQTLCSIGWEQPMPYALPSEHKTDKIAFQLAGVVWKEFLTNHPEFLGRLLSRLQFWQKQQQLSNPNMPANAWPLFNSNVLAQAAGRVEPEFMEWYHQQHLFRISQAGQQATCVFINEKNNEVDIFTIRFESGEMILPGSLGTAKFLAAKPFPVTLHAGRFALQTESGLHEYSQNLIAPQIDSATEDQTQQAVPVFRRKP